MAGENGAAAREWRTGWPIVVGSTAGMSLLGMGFVAAGTFFAPLEREFGWNRTEISSAFLVYAVASVLLGPLVGIALDRWGPRRVALLGSVLTGLTWALFSTLNGSIAYWLFLWLLFACACQLIMVNVWTTAISGSFAVNRGLALAIAMTGPGFATLISPNLANNVIEHHGWRSAFLVMGLGWAGLITLICYFTLHDRHSRVSADPSTTPQAELPGYTVREGLRSAAFAKIIVAVFLVNLFNNATMVHLVPILSSSGLPRDTAVWVYSLLGVTGTIGTLANGVILDRIPARLYAVVLVALPMISCALLLQPTDSVVQRAFAANLFGFAAGVQLPTLFYLSTRYFGLRSYGTLSGFISAAMAIPTAIGPFVAGMLYDRTGNYSALLIAGFPIAIIACFTVFSLGRYPQFEEAGEARPAEPATA
jgi:predicted MFS family arabinose efflux permease